MAIITLTIDAEGHSDEEEFENHMNTRSRYTLLRFVFFSGFFHYYWGLFSCFVRISIMYAKIHEKKSVSSRHTPNAFTWKFTYQQPEQHMFVFTLQMYRIMCLCGILFQADGRKRKIQSNSNSKSNFLTWRVSNAVKQRHKPYGETMCMDESNYNFFKKKKRHTERRSNNVTYAKLWAALCERHFLYLSACFMVRFIFILFSCLVLLSFLSLCLFDSSGISLFCQLHKVLGDLCKPIHFIAHHWSE